MQIISGNNYGVAKVRLWYTSVQTLVWKVYEMEDCGPRTLQDDDWSTDFDKQVKRK